MLKMLHVYKHNKGKNWRYVDWCMININNMIHNCMNTGTYYISSIE